MRKIIFIFLFSFGFNSAFSEDLNKIIYAENRLGYGTNFSEQEYIKKMGLSKWIELQLKGNIPETDLLNKAIGNLDISKYSLPVILDKVQEEKDDSEDKKKIARTLQELVKYQTFQRDALRSIYSKNQLKQKMTWFWFNHFNVYSKKGPVKVFIGDYQENVIHKNALGNFRTLLKETLKSPAMSFYLDNFKNTSPNSLVAKNKKDSVISVNENYAREILELHTLGQGNDYSQKDIQELAKILTGFTFRKNNDPINIQNKEIAKYVVIDNYFVFDPRMHDFGDKIFMGHKIKGTGYNEIEEVLDILISNPNTAKNICKKLAIYFVDDNPSDLLINKMSYAFLKTKGDIPSVLNVLFNSDDFWNVAGKNNKFKLPHEFVYSSLKLTYDSNIISNFYPLWQQMKNLGETPYEHLTPDGYGLKNNNWTSPDQMNKRFTFSSLFNNPKTPLFNDDEFVSRAYNIISQKNFPIDTSFKNDSPVNYQNAYNVFSSYLSENTKQVLNDATPKEKIGYLLSSPEFVNK